MLTFEAGAVKRNPGPAVSPTWHRCPSEEVEELFQVMGGRRALKAPKVCFRFGSANWAAWCMAQGVPVLSPVAGEFVFSPRGRAVGLLALPAFLQMAPCCLHLLGLWNSKCCKGSGGALQRPSETVW